MIGGFFIRDEFLWPDILRMTHWRRRFDSVIMHGSGKAACIVVVRHVSMERLDVCGWSGG